MLRVLSFYVDGVDHNLEYGVYRYKEVFFFFKGKSFDLIAIGFLSELVLVTVGLEVDNVLLTDQSTGGQSVIF